MTDKPLDCKAEVMFKNIAPISQLFHSDTKVIKDLQGRIKKESPTWVEYGAAWFESKMPIDTTATEVPKEITHNDHNT